jgi:CcmD family protein
MIYLAAALIILWLSVGAFVVYMLVRQRALEREVEMLEEQLQAAKRKK